MDSVSSVLRKLFIWLDYAVYWLIDQMYSLFSLLTEASIFTQDQIESFSNRIYVLVSIIMFFRLGFAFVNYIVNPESFSDKQKGGGALIKKIVITMALLVSVPTIFNEAYYVQQLVFKNNIIDKVLLGDNVVQNENVNKNRALSTYAFMSFFKPSQVLKDCQNYKGISIDDTCVNVLNSEDDSGGNPGTAYKKALETYDINLILKAEVVNAQGDAFSTTSNDFFQTTSYYLFDYNYPVSTAVGIAIAWILLGFCLDLAVRVVKLGFLEIIAPIPIILSLAPTQKNNTLGNWGKECISTWASLFIRVMVISFALSTIITINSGGGIFSFVTGGTNQFSIVTVFVMIGILLFAKEFPKLLEDILGIKGAGKMTFNALRKIADVPLVGGLTMAGASYLGNTAKNVLGAGFNRMRGRDTNWKENQDFAKKEALGRLHHSGLMGSNKKYSGDTQHKLVQKRNQEHKKQIFEAEKGFDDKKDKWDLGHKSIEKQKDLGASAQLSDYKKAGFKNDNFIKAAMGVEQTKDALKVESQNLTRANEQVSALTNKLYSLDKADPNYQKNYDVISKELEDATHDRDGYHESVEKIEKTLKSRQEIFEKNIAPLSPKDYELYQARNVAKGEDPTAYKESASIPRFTDVHYKPGSYTIQSNVQTTPNINGVKLTPTSTGGYTTPSGIYVPGSAVNSGVNNPTSVPQNNPQPTSPQSGSQPPKTGFAGSPTARTTKGGQNQ